MINDDLKAIQSDWKAVRDDLRVAMERIAHEGREGQEDPEGAGDPESAGIQSSQEGEEVHMVGDGNESTHRPGTALAIIKPPDRVRVEPRRRLVHEIIRLKQQRMILAGSLVGVLVVLAIWAANAC
jgi:hypothetical protein